MSSVIFHRIADRFVHSHNRNVGDIVAAVRHARLEGLLGKCRQADAVARVRELLGAQLKVRQTRKPRGADLPALPLLERAALRSKHDAGSSYDSAKYRTCTQGHVTRVCVGAPGVKSDVVRGDRYSSSCAFRKNESVHTLTIPALWCVRVQARGLAVVDGMFTLDAQRVPGTGAELYRAVWIEQGAGTSLKLARGYIARLEGITYHATTARAALEGVRRKSGVISPRRKIDLDRVARRYGNLPVALADSLAVGNCQSGTVSWCHAVGLDPFATVALADVLRAYQLRPMPEALAVIRHVVREHRSWTKLLGEPQQTVRFDAEGGFRIL